MARDQADLQRSKAALDLIIRSAQTELDVVEAELAKLRGQTHLDDAFFWREVVALMQRRRDGLTTAELIRVLREDGHHFSDGATFPLRDAVRLMIAVSDNTATNLVLEQTGIKEVNTRMAGLGLADVDVRVRERCAIVRQEGVDDGRAREVARGQIRCRRGLFASRGAEGADPASVAFDAVSSGIAAGADVVVVDTAGRLHTKTGLMDELGKVKRVVEKRAVVDEVLLVLDATIGQNGLAQAKVFSEVVDITGVALTKLDGTAKGGIVFRVQQDLGVPVKLVGLGEGPDDLAPFEPGAFVDALLG